MSDSIGILDGKCSLECKSEGKEKLKGESKEKLWSD
jgi:hypothetical protein